MKERYRRHGPLRAPPQGHRQTFKASESRGRGIAEAIRAAIVYQQQRRNPARRLGPASWCGRI
jgi:hypothetical protein